MAPLTTLSAEAQRALKDLRLRSGARRRACVACGAAWGCSTQPCPVARADTHGHLRACEQVARDADGDQRRASGHHEARADVRACSARLA